MFRADDYVKVSDLAEAYELCQKRSSLVVADGMDENDSYYQAYYCRFVRAWTGCNRRKRRRGFLLAVCAVYASLETP